MLRYTLLLISLIFLLAAHPAKGQTPDDIWRPIKATSLDLNDIAVARVAGSAGEPVVDILLPQYKVSGDLYSYTYFSPVKKLEDGKETEEFLPQVGTKDVKAVEFVVRLSAKIDLLKALRIDGTELSTEQLKVALRKPTHVILHTGSVASAKYGMSKYHSAVFRDDLIVLIMPENKIAESIVSGTRVQNQKK